MRIFTVICYFFLTIIIFASTGVVIPYILEAIQGTPHKIRDLNQNIVTYFIAIFASACLDLILKLIDKESRSRKAVILALLIICILVVAGTAFLLYYNANGGQNGIKTYLTIGVILSFVMWWIAHYKDEAFNPPVSSLGGSTDNPLRN